jgi:hypothetical protein
MFKNVQHRILGCGAARALWSMRKRSALGSISLVFHEQFVCRASSRGKRGLDRAISKICSFFDSRLEMFNIESLDVVPLEQTDQEKKDAE